MKTYEELLAERDALAATVRTLKMAIMSNCYDDPSTSGKRLMELANATPQQCLTEIKADAVEVAYYNGFKDALVIEPPLQPATCASATIDVFAYRVDQASRYAASQYANKIRNTGTWLKDSNVNGGKRQGGEK